MKITDETQTLTPEILHKVDHALSGIKEGTKGAVEKSGLDAAYVQNEKSPEENHDKGKWSAYGLTREQASERAMSAIRSELGTIASSEHGGWNKAIEAMMLEGNSNPGQLWAMYRKLVAADTRMEIGGGPADSRPDATPAVAKTTEQDKSPSVG